jgi:hypothetical protein
MFSFPRSFGTPGFNVRDPDTEADDGPPGFVVPSGGYPPVGVDPAAIVPANCTTIGGSASCATPTGRLFSEPAPTGFPGSIEPAQRNYHSYHFQSEPVDIPADKLSQAIVASPTPNVTPASDGRSTIHVEGEGLAPLQGPDEWAPIRRSLNDATWRRYFEGIVKRAK